MNKREPEDRLVGKIKFGKSFPRAVDWSPDGTRLAIGDYLGGVQVLNTTGKTLWRTVDQTKAIMGVSWSPDGRRIASVSPDYYACINDAATGELLIRGKAGLGNCGITWSPDGSRLAWSIGGGGSEFIVRIFDSATGQTLVDGKGHTKIIPTVSWSPNGKKIASSSADTTIRIWDTNSGKCLSCLKGHSEQVFDICWSPDSSCIASVSVDRTLRVWLIESGECIFRCEGHSSDIRSICWSYDGSILASGSLDNTLRLWNAVNGSQLLHINHPDAVIDVSFSPDNSALASISNDGLIRIWNVSDITHSKPKESLMLDSTFDRYITRQAATIGYKLPITKKRPMWVPSLPEKNGKCLGVLREQYKETYYLATISPVAIFPYDQTIVTGSGDGYIRRWDLRTGNPIWQGSERHEAYINNVAVSVDGTRIASASGDGIVRIWNADNGKIILLCAGHKGAVRNVRWSPDGKRFASIEYSDDKQLRIWDAVKGATLRICKGHTKVTQALSWSSDGRFIASGDDGGNINIWDPDTGQLSKQFNVDNKPIWGLSWSPDSHYLLIGFKDDGKVSIINMFDDSLQLRYLKHCTDVVAMDWSPDGRLLVTASQYSDKTIRVWDAHTGKKLHGFSLKNDSCHRLAWSLDGGFILSSHLGGIYQFWDARDLLPKANITATGHSPLQKVPITQHLRFMPPALAQMHRLNIFPPLSLIRDILDLLADRCEIESLNTLMASNRGLQELRDMHWPFAARIGMVALLLHRLPPSEWQPPENTTPSQVRDALMIALAGESSVPQPPAPPISLLTQAAELIDDHLISLLSMLGPHAVAADPGLPLRLLPRVKDIPALSITQRRSLGVLISTAGISGQSTGRAPGADRVQVGDIEMSPLRSDFTSLLPSQLAMPPIVQMYRHLRSELLFRAREMAEPPRLRPAVILLDVSPPSFGPIEQITRLAAYTIAQSIRRAGLRVILVSTSEGIACHEWVLELTHPADLLEIWALRTLKSAYASRSLKLAEVLSASLSESQSPEPVIVLLSHPFFGAEENLPKIKNLRGLFVQYPGQTHTPALATTCEKWRSIEATQPNDLSNILGVLIS